MHVSCIQEKHDFDQEEWIGKQYERMRRRIRALKYNSIEKGEVEGDGNYPTLIVVCLTAAPCMEPAGAATVTFFGEAC